MEWWVRQALLENQAGELAIRIGRNGCRVVWRAAHRRCSEWLSERKGKNLTGRVGVDWGWPNIYRPIKSVA